MHERQPGPDSTAELRNRVEDFLRERHVMTVATVGRAGGSAVGDATDSHNTPEPHAAPVFYAVDRHMRLVFLSKGSSRHASHIREGSAVAVAVSGEFADWREIRGVQMWGRAEILRGGLRAAAFAVYVTRFPFVLGLLRDSELRDRLEGMEVLRFSPARAELTDNTRGLFGREALLFGAESTQT